MINEVKFASPLQWINDNSVPVFPCALFTINDGQYNIGREVVYKINLWFLDKSGMEAEFEREITSDMLQVAMDIINKLRLQSNQYGISTNISWTALTEKFEDYLTGVTLSFDLSVVNSFTSCDVPVI